MGDESAAVLGLYLPLHNCWQHPVHCISLAKETAPSSHLAQPFLFQNESKSSSYESHLLHTHADGAALGGLLVPLEHPVRVAMADWEAAGCHGKVCTDVIKINR